MPRMNKVGSCATKVTRNENELRVRYHNTDVVVVDYERRTVTLDTGGITPRRGIGHGTFTTKARMNQTSNEYCLGYSVYQSKGDWYVNTPNEGTVLFEDDTITFQMK